MSISNSAFSPETYKSINAFIKKCDSVIRDLNAAHNDDTNDIGTSNTSIGGRLYSNYSSFKNKKVAERVDRLAQKAAELNQQLTLEGHPAVISIQFDGKNIKLCEAAEKLQKQKPKVKKQTTEVDISREPVLQHQTSQPVTLAEKSQNSETDSKNCHQETKTHAEQEKKAYKHIRNDGEFSQATAAAILSAKTKVEAARDQMRAYVREKTVSTQSSSLPTGSTSLDNSVPDSLQQPNQTSESKTDISSTESKASQTLLASPAESETMPSYQYPKIGFLKDMTCPLLTAASLVVGAIALRFFWALD